jgi:hypothetical protein
LSKAIIIKCSGYGGNNDFTSIKMNNRNIYSFGAKNMIYDFLNKFKKKPHLK